MKSLAVFSFIILAQASALAAEVCQNVFSVKTEVSATAIPIVTEISPDLYVKGVLRDTVQKIDEYPALESDILKRPRFDVAIRAKRNPFVAFLYENKLIHADEISFRMQDKLMMYKLLQHYLGATKARVIHPHTVGVKEFLYEQNLIDATGAVRASSDKIMAALKTAFPNGFIVKPTVGQNSSGKQFYFDQKEIVAMLANEKGSDIYQSAERNVPFLVEGTPISGERFILQERLNVSDSSAVGSANEYRVHSYADKVIDGATLSRWKIISGNGAFKSIDGFVQSLLSQLPKQVTDRQAWSFDVFQDAQGNFALVEINTNKGKTGNWSGFVKSPKVLGAYIRHFEKNFNWNFKGFAGVLLRNNLGNITHSMKFVVEKYWDIFLKKYLVHFKKISPAAVDQEMKDLPQ